MRARRNPRLGLILPRQRARLDESALKEPAVAAYNPERFHGPGSPAGVRRQRMGSAWDHGQTAEEAELPGQQLKTARPSIGLQASELDQLRSAPDFDAEEMATVRAPGGWPPVSAPAPTPAPEFPEWQAPNRIEPPRRAAFTLGPATLPGGAATTRFPEERTVALMAEDLLGRPLQEPVPQSFGSGDERDPSFGAQASAGTRKGGFLAGGADLWDQVMPLTMEG
jgi:hypothetical protein